MFVDMLVRTPTGLVSARYEAHTVVIRNDYDTPLIAAKDDAVPGSQEIQTVADPGFVQFLAKLGVSAPIRVDTFRAPPMPGKLFL